MTCTGSSPSRTSVFRDPSRRFQRPSSRTRGHPGLRTGGFPAELNHHPLHETRQLPHARARLLCAIAPGARTFRGTPCVRMAPIFGPCEKSRRRDRFAGCRWGRTIPRSAGVVRRVSPRGVLRAPAVHVSPLSFRRKPTPAVCADALSLERMPELQTPGYLFAGDKTGNYTFFIFRMRYGTWSIYSNAILVTVICTSGFRADLFISAIRRSEFRKAA